MRFLFVGSSPDHGGAEAHFIALAQALLGAGHEVVAMVHPDGFIASELDRSGLSLYRTRFRNVLDLSAYAVLSRAIHETRPHALIGNFGKDYWPLVLAGRLSGIPAILFRHRVAALNPLSNRLLPRLAYGYFSVSEYARRAYQEHGIAAGRIQVLHNPVDVVRYRFMPESRRQILQSLGIGEEAIVVGYCGRLLKSKGIYTLLKAATLAMAQDPRLHCLWVGEDVDGRHLRDRIAIQRYADRHHFVGLVDDAHRYYSAFSMLAFPSLAPETFGRVSIEAQACNVPVLGSDIGGVPETLRPGDTGLLIPPGDSQAWKEGIITMCDPARRLPMASAARDFVERHFSYPVIVQKFLSFIETRHLRHSG